MKIQEVADRMNNAISVLAFMNTATVNLSEDSEREMSDPEICGMQEVFFYIERELKECSECVSENVGYLQQALRAAEELKAAS